MNIMIILYVVSFVTLPNPLSLHHCLTLATNGLWHELQNKLFPKLLSHDVQDKRLCRLIKVYLKHFKVKSHWHASCSGKYIIIENDNQIDYMQWANNRTTDLSVSVSDPRWTRPLGTIVCLTWTQLNGHDPFIRCVVYNSRSRNSIRSTAEHGVHLRALVPIQLPADTKACQLPSLLRCKLRTAGIPTTGCARIVCAVVYLILLGCVAVYGCCSVSLDLNRFIFLDVIALFSSLRPTASRADPDTERGASHVTSAAERAQFIEFVDIIS